MLKNDILFQRELWKQVLILTKKYADVAPLLVFWGFKF